MKTWSLVVVIAAAVWAADFTRTAEPADGLAEHFQQLDRTGDGKLTVEELGVPKASGTVSWGRGGATG
jgi:hypothetical protein